MSESEACGGGCSPQTPPLPPKSLHTGPLVQFDFLVFVFSAKVVGFVHEGFSFLLY